MVWKASQQIGCAMASCNNLLQMTYVCLYTPPGNVNSLDEFAANVLHPTTESDPVPSDPFEGQSSAARVMSAFNAERAKHGAPPLGWSNDLVNSAQVGFNRPIVL